MNGYDVDPADQRRVCPKCGRRIDRLQGSPGAGAGKSHIAIAYPCQCWLSLDEAAQISGGAV